MIQWPKEKGQKTNNDLQNNQQKTTDQATRSPQNSRVNSTRGTVVLLLLQTRRSVMNAFQILFVYLRK